MLCNSYNSKNFIQRILLNIPKRRCKLLVIIDNNRLVFEIKIVRDLSC